MPSPKPVHRATLAVQVTPAEGPFMARASAADPLGQLVDLPPQEQAAKLAARALGDLVANRLPALAAERGWPAESGLVAHARHELELCGQTAQDPEYAASILAAVAAFASYGHSGGSAYAGMAQLAALLNFEALSPLTADPDEWHDHGLISGSPLWQNRRQGSAFTDDPTFATYWVVDDVPSGSAIDASGGRHRYRTGVVDEIAPAGDGPDEPGSVELAEPVETPSAEPDGVSAAE